MSKATAARLKDPLLKWMLLAIPVVFIVSGPLHFLFDWTRRSVIAGLFAPVNESVWEHLKLSFWPILVWWLAGYLLLGRKKSGAPARFAVTCAISEVVCMLVITAFFYTYTGAFGIESLALDVLSLFLGLVVAVLTARHVVIHTRPGGAASFISVVVVVALAAAFICFTFAPPRLPVFQDPQTGTYGINA